MEINWKYSDRKYLFSIGFLLYRIVHVRGTGLKMIVEVVSNEKKICNHSPADLHDYPVFLLF